MLVAYEKNDGYRKIGKKLVINSKEFDSNFAFLEFVSKRIASDWAFDFGI